LLREEARCEKRQLVDLGASSNFNIYERWGIGQPNNVNNNQHCVLVDVNETHALLDDENCQTKYRYVCEVSTYFILK